MTWLERVADRKCDDCKTDQHYKCTSSYLLDGDEVYCYCQCAANKYNKDRRWITRLHAPEGELCRWCETTHPCAEFQRIEGVLL